MGAGLLGTITAPLEGAKESGAGGFLKGIGRGAAGLFVKPAAGSFDFMSRMFEGGASTFDFVQGKLTNDRTARDEDFGRERSTGDPADRYKFRSTPLRNVAYQPSFMHNGAFVCLDNSIRHHLEMQQTLETFNPEHLEYRLHARRGPDGPMIQRAHHLSKNPRGRLTDEQFTDLVAFVEISLSDPEAHPDALRHLIPATVPSGLPVHDFDFGAPEPECR